LRASRWQQVQTKPKEKQLDHIISSIEKMAYEKVDPRQWNQEIAKEGVSAFNPSMAEQSKNEVFRRVPLQEYFDKYSYYPWGGSESSFALLEEIFYHLLKKPQPITTLR